MCHLNNHKLLPFIFSCVNQTLWSHWGRVYNSTRWSEEEEDQILVNKPNSVTSISQPKQQCLPLRLWQDEGVLIRNLGVCTVWGLRLVPKMKGWAEDVFYWVQRARWNSCRSTCFGFTCLPCFAVSEPDVRRPHHRRLPTSLPTPKD